jgi:hypothetical protein
MLQKASTPTCSTVLPSWSPSKRSQHAGRDKGDDRQLDEFHGHLRSFSRALPSRMTGQAAPWCYSCDVGAIPRGAAHWLIVGFLLFDNQQDRCH